MGSLAGRPLRAVFGSALVCGSLGAAALGFAGPAGASNTVTLYVSTSGTKTTGCTGSGTAACKSIQEGITAAEALTGDAVTVTVAAGVYTVVGTGGVAISASGLSSLTVQGAGASLTVATGGGRVGIFTVSSGTVTLRDVAVDQGHAATGGGVDSTNGNVTVTDDTFSNDIAVDGGGVDSTNGNVTVTDDTFSNDVAIVYGGGFALARGMATVTDDTFFSDLAGIGGGGVWYTRRPTATMTDDTFSGDLAPTGGAVDEMFGSATITASLFDGTTCSKIGGALSGTYDVTTTSSCNFGATDETVTASAIGLSPLALNTSTGPETMAIGSTSAAYEIVPEAECTVTTDERGEPRPGVPGQNCDAGAYEYQVATATIVVCIPATQTCRSQTSRPGTSTTVSSKDVTVTASGRGVVAVGTYHRDPARMLASGTGKYFGVSLSSPNRITSLVVKDCNLGGGATLEWWNGHTWLRVVGETGTTYTSTCTSVTLGATSSPTLTTITKLSRHSRFGAVVFGVIGETPVT